MKPLFFITIFTTMYMLYGMEEHRHQYVNDSIIINAVYWAESSSNGKNELYFFDANGNELLHEQWKLFPLTAQWHSRIHARLDAKAPPAKPIQAVVGLNESAFDKAYLVFLDKNGIVLTRIRYNGGPDIKRDLTDEQVKALWCGTGNPGFRLDPYAVKKVTELEPVVIGMTGDKPTLFSRDTMGKPKKCTRIWYHFDGSKKEINAPF